MQPILKWAGGKDKELRYILPAAPDVFDNYYEPFVGGGAVFMAVEADHYFVNDFSEELISLYRYLAAQDNRFFDLAEAIDRSWLNADLFYDNSQELMAIYMDYRQGVINKDVLSIRINEFCQRNHDEIVDVIDNVLALQPEIFVEELEKNLKRKMVRMFKLEHEKHELPVSDIGDNIRTAIKSALYMYFRHLYNHRELYENDGQMYCAIFLFIRNYCYSGMFRYNDDGEFNVPYGGMAYNNKTLERKLEYYRSADLVAHFADTEICNFDFEEFFHLHNPGAEDFVFLDPPYDSEFSTYAQNEFTRADHERLAAYLINECHARWMLVIKNTDFIFGLYHHPGINIREFNKTYQVSFMNRNDRDVQHLLITNY